MPIDLKSIHTKRQSKRKEKKVYKTSNASDKPKFYVLDMFPYPSGAGLHVGHPKGYIATDIIARKKMLEGYNVLHPMGWDAFGLPAENYAIKNKVNPKISTQDNIKKFKNQLEKIGFTYDRDREINTTDPDYYKWTQWIFIQLYNHYYDDKKGKAKTIKSLKSEIEKGNIQIPKGIDLEDFLDSKRLAYVDYKPIIRCPSCKTGLAQEDLEDGKCERCGSEIEMKPMKQRVLRITAYAERLLKDLDVLEDRPKSILEMQKNWIGKSSGTEFSFETEDGKNKINVFTTRIDTIFGASYVVLAPEHPLVEQITTNENKTQVQKYTKKAKAKSELQRTDLNKDKTGVFTGGYCVNPFNGDKLPVWVADYVLMGYGTGAVMVVPAHDQRDMEFAKKYDLPIKQVINPIYGDDKHENESNVDGVVAVVFDPNTQKYLSLYRKSSKHYVNICGGLEKGEDYKQCAIREVAEESGYSNFKEVIKLNDEMFARFFNQNKKTYRFAKIVPFLVILEDDSNDGQKLDQHEKGKIQCYWSDPLDILKKFNQTIPTSNHQNEILRLAVNKAIELGYDKTNNKNDFEENAKTQKGFIINSGKYTGLESDIAIEKMQNRLQNNNIGGKKDNYKIQDWVFSRQRYWGEPIPVVWANK